MRHTFAILALCGLAALVAVLQARGTAAHGLTSWALFSFAVLAFRDPVG